MANDRTGDWRLTPADAGVLVARADGRPEAAGQAFCRVFVYARDHGFRLLIKPQSLADYVERTAAAAVPPALEPDLLAAPWLATTMHNILGWFNDGVRVPDGYRVDFCAGELVLRAHPASAPTVEHAGLLYDIDEHRGAESAALQTLLLAERLGWSGLQKWKKLSWRAEWEDPASFSDKKATVLFDESEAAVAWLNAHPSTAPAGYQYHFDDRGQLWLQQRAASPTDQAVTRVPSSPASAPLFSHIDR